MNGLYLEKERTQDHKRWRSPALFLSPATNPHGDGRLNPKIVNTAWNEVCKIAGVIYLAWRWYGEEYLQGILIDDIRVEEIAR